MIVIDSCYSQLAEESQAGWAERVVNEFCNSDLWTWSCTAPSDTDSYQALLDQLQLGEEPRGELGRVTIRVHTLVWHPSTAIFNWLYRRWQESSYTAWTDRGDDQIERTVHSFRPLIVSSRHHPKMVGEESTGHNRSYARLYTQHYHFDTTTKTISLTWEQPYNMTNFRHVNIENPNILTTQNFILTLQIGYSNCKGHIFPYITEPSASWKEEHTRFDRNTGIYFVQAGGGPIIFQYHLPFTVSDDGLDLASHSSEWIRDYRLSHNYNADHSS